MASEGTSRRAVSVNVFSRPQSTGCCTGGDNHTRTSVATFDRLRVQPQAMHASPEPMNRQSGWLREEPNVAFVLHTNGRAREQLEEEVLKSEEVGNWSSTVALRDVTGDRTGPGAECIVAVTESCRPPSPPTTLWI